MSQIRLVAGSAFVFLVVAGAAHAEDISAKKILIKDNPNPVKRQLQLQSADPGVLSSEVDNPIANGAAIHVYSATDNQCVVLPGGPEWTVKKGLWKYNNKVTKNQVQVADKKLQVKLKSGVTISLADNGTQGAVNAQVQFGSGGARYCMRCTGTKDDAKHFLGKNCVAAACDAEPSSCVPPPPPTPGIKLKGALPPTSGRFNFNLVLGVPGADAACNGNFAGTHACTYADLQAAETAGDLDGLKDLNAGTVTSFWAIDGSHPGTLQCGETIPWDYQTAHTGHFAEKVNLNNATGALSALMSGLPDNAICAGSSWVGCCL
jgi:hypothetical protein